MDAVAVASRPGLLLLFAVTIAGFEEDEIGVAEFARTDDSEGVDDAEMVAGDGPGTQVDRIVFTLAGLEDDEDVDSPSRYNFLNLLEFVLELGDAISGIYYFKVTYRNRIKNTYFCASSWYFMRI